MPSIPQATRKTRRTHNVTPINPEAQVFQLDHNLFAAYDPPMNGSTWEEHVKHMQDANPDGVVLDLDRILESERPLETYYEMILTKCPNIEPRHVEQQANVIAQIVKRKMEKEHNERMEKMREELDTLQRRNNELSRERGN